MRYFVSQIQKVQQFENIGVQPENFRNVVATFVMLCIIGKVFAPHLSRSSIDMEYSVSQNTAGATIRKRTCTAGKFEKCVYSIPRMNTTGKTFNPYLSRSSSGRGYLISQHIEDTTIRKYMFAAEEFVNCRNNIFKSVYYWKGFDIYLSRSSSGMGYFLSQHTEDETIWKHCLQPRNLWNVVTTFLTLSITGKIPYLSRRSLHMGYYISKSTEGTTIRKYAGQPENLRNFVKTL